MSNPLEQLLEQAKNDDMRRLIHSAFNLGLDYGAKFQQGRCGKCKLWDGTKSVPDHYEIRRKLWGE